MRSADKVSRDAQANTDAVRYGLLVAASGVLAGITTVAFIYLLVFGYYVVTPANAERQGAARDLAIGWAPATFFVLAVGILALVASYKTGTRHLAGGFLVGVSAVATMQGLIALQYPPVVPNEVLWYGVLGAGAGLLGGRWGIEEAKRTVAGERALLAAMRDISNASTGDAVARAMGATLVEGLPAGVAIWRTWSGNRDGTSDEPGTWTADASRPFVPERLVAAASPTIKTWDHPRTVLPETLAEAGHRKWAEQGIRSAFVSPLLALGGESFGLLFIGFRERRWLTGRTRRRLLSAAAGAATALEKLAAWEKDREREKRLGVLEERERLSREIHDSLIQYLGGITRELDGAEMASEADAQEMVWRHVSRARKGARLAAGEARRLIRALRPEVLDGSSLPEALEVLARRLSEESGIEITSRVAGEVRPLAPEAEHALARIAQEALNNVCRHSGAAHAAVSLSFSKDRVVLEVADDGAGLGGKPKRGNTGDSGFGMRSMHERAERIGGRLRMEGLEGTGTKVSVEAPIRAGAG